jgi:hypothetical protein
MLEGVLERAKLLENNSGQHSTWCVDPKDITLEPSFTHFHWAGPEERNELIIGAIYDGYLLKLTAIDSFSFIHGGRFPITPGTDFISHDNVVTGCY